MSENKPQPSAYNAKNIIPLTPREHIRRRPGMYLGGTDIRGLHHLIWAITDHMIEEAVLGLCTYIHLEINDDNDIQIRSNGTSLIDSHATVESNSKILDELLADCKTRASLDDMYFGVQGGLHGMGLGVANCLSQRFSLSIEHQSDVWMHFYEQGLAVDRIIHQSVDDSTREQTTIRFKPDFEVMDANDFDARMIANRFHDLSYLFPNLELLICDNRTNGDNFRYKTQHGLADWASDTATIPVCEVIRGQKTYELSDKFDKPYKVGVQFAFQFTGANHVNERSFINTVPTPDGGTHIEALHDAILQYIVDDPQADVIWEDISRGFVGIIHLLHPEPEFEGLMSMKITNPDVHDLVFDCVRGSIAENPDALVILHENLVIQE